MFGNIITSIDIGTAKIVTIIAKVSKDKSSLEVLGYGFSRSKGLNKGVVVDVEETSASIDKSVREAERVAGIKIRSATVGVSGSHISSATVKSSITVAKYPREITINDKRNLENFVESKNLGVDRSVLHRIAYDYRIDDGDYVRSPIGMIGCKLDAEVHIVSGAVNSIGALIRCVRNLGIRVKNVVLEPLASAEAALSDTEKRVGAVLVDIGGGTTDIAIIRNGKLVHTSVIPVGGDHFTNDIAAVLNMDTKSAEYLKKSLKSLIEKSHKSDVSISKDIDLDIVRTIIESRMNELVEHIANRLSDSRYSGFVRGGIILAGGGSKIFGLEEAIRSRFHVSTRIGVPLTDFKLPEDLRTPEAVTGVGLLLTDMKKNKYKRFFYSGSYGKMSFIGMLKERFADMFDIFVDQVRR